MRFAAEIWFVRGPGLTNGTLAGATKSWEAMTVITKRDRAFSVFVITAAPEFQMWPMAPNA